MWQTIDSAPSNRRIELCVIERDEVHALAFPCRRQGMGWVNASTDETVFVHPTHWQDWRDGGRDARPAYRRVSSPILP